MDLPLSGSDRELYDFWRKGITMTDLRMPEYNYSSFTGRLTRDPELRRTGAGVAICSMGVAISEHFKDKSGQRQEKTAFINVVVWDKQGEYCHEHLKKGYPVWVEGSLTSDQWEDKDTGAKRTKVEVRARRVQQLDWNNSNAGGGRQETKPTEPDNRAMPQDDIPF